MKFFILFFINLIINKKVNIDLYVLPLCNDAKRCESIFNEINEEMNEKVNININFISKGNENQYGIKCRFEKECFIIKEQFCIKMIYPNKSLKYAICYNLNHNSFECINLLKMNKNKLNECIMNNNNNLLLKNHVKLSSKLNINKSCTVVFEGKKICLLDQGKWKNCKGNKNEFIQKINHLYFNQ